MGERCSTCKFWNRARRASWTDFNGSKSYLIEHAQCRRHAPARVAADQKSPVPGRAFPHVNADEWCGEWQDQSTGGR